jgi:small subunit ribosomal protein S4
MPKRKQKKFERPRKLYDKTRIDEEGLLVKKYGLKNKREIWRADFAIGKIRNVAKGLITASEEEKEKFIGLQKKKGFEVENMTEVLGLNKEDFLRRRLQSVLVKKGLCRTYREARQRIAHRHVTIDGNIINVPSHLTTLEEENNIALVIKPLKDKLTKKETDQIEEIKQEAEASVEEKEGKEESPAEVEEVKEGAK